ncbi:site-specific DNA-methyltransferase [Corynebacterium hindlerae]|uniref:site-specific DNA-methyltransferase n=1 Tax=Corynebacterium hindlerae TaxID=699041 RepID=UPI001AD77C85|nr:site-specific DNA-methyltransferase [Corynebacterium hindlerae]QTH60509.1 site-specific DNA-methyltransferase [Corynebacterium hindlerae]
MTQQKLELTWFNKDQALIPQERGRYGYTWVDPHDPRYCQTHYLIEGETVTGEQAPKQDGTQYSERADLEPTTDNLLINGESGDVLEALTRVPKLAEKYVGKVKCIYIDPPFNTAQTFANYEDNLEHSVWLTMMRDRLLHMKKLLSEDGSIWVHLDDVENHRMRLLMDEVFGAGNFVAEVVWEKTYSPRNDSKGIPAVTDTILVYRKSNQFSPNRLPRTAEMNNIYKNPDNDPRGAWTSDNPCAPGAATHLGMIYGIQHPITGEMVYPTPGTCWRYSQNKMKEIFSGWGPYELGEITPDEIAQQQKVAGTSATARTDVPPLVYKDWNIDQGAKAWEIYENGPWPQFYPTRGGLGGFRRKSWLKDAPGRTPTNLLQHVAVGHTDAAAKEIRALFPGQSPFATPKPERLLERVIHIATNPGDIVLDVFAGSGTTAAVAHKMGRRWVTCELLEDTFNRFTVPRLTKVVRGEDMGGITTTKGERVDDTADGLPEGMSADDAQKFTSLLNKVIKDNPELKNSAQVKELKAATKTRNSGDVVNWRGGGSFTIATLSKPCFDVDEDLGLTILTEHADADNLARSVAAHLRFTLTPEHPVFPGRRGNMWLYVTRQPVDERVLDELLSYLGEGEAVTVASTSVLPEHTTYLHKRAKGSRALSIPDGLFTHTLSTKDEA